MQGNRVQRVFILVLALNLAVALAKAIFGLLAGSVSMVADAFHSGFDSFSNVVGIVALYFAGRPPDPEHPYGHGKIEFLSAMFEGGMVLMAAIFIVVRTFDAMWRGDLVQEQRLGVGLAMVVLALFVNGGVGFYLLRTGRKQDSMTLEADGKHLLSDALTSIAVLVGLGLVKLTGWVYFDPITALLLGVNIGWMALGLIRRSGGRLMDRQDMEDMQLLTEILERHVGPEGKEPRICAYHKLRHRHTGRFHWVDFHIQVPATWTIEHAHEVAGAIEGEMERALGDANATAHIEPYPDRDCPWCQPEH